jgi:hypothetical protein
MLGPAGRTQVLLLLLLRAAQTCRQGLRQAGRSLLGRRRLLLGPQSQQGPRCLHWAGQRPQVAAQTQQGHLQLLLAAQSLLRLLAAAQSRS